MEIEWEELTIEELLENRRDLVDSHVATQLEVLTTQRTTLTEELAAVKAELESAQAALVAQPERIAELELDLAIEQASQISVGKEIAQLLHERVTAIEQIPEMAAAARDEAITRVISSSASGPTNAKGSSRLPDNKDTDADDANTDPVLTEEQAVMVGLVSGPTTRR